MTPRIDWLTAALWLVLGTAALLLLCVGANSVLWLVQQVALALWPAVRAKPVLLYAALLALCIAVIAMWSKERKL